MVIDFVTLLPIFMFLALAILLFSGFPVAFVLGGVGLGFGFIGLHFEVFSFIEFFNIISRIWGSVCENLLLVAVPMFIFMGTMLERSGVANDLLNCLQVLLRRVPGGLALSVTIMGTIMAATTGIIGASVVGKNATDLISEATIAIREELTINEIKKTVHAHPTLSEIWYEAVNHI